MRTQTPNSMTCQKVEIKGRPRNGKDGWDIKEYVFASRNGWLVETIRAANQK